jgi:hypothetical protein
MRRVGVVTAPPDFENKFKAGIDMVFLKVEFEHGRLQNSLYRRWYDNYGINEGICAVVMV